MAMSVLCTGGDSATAMTDAVMPIARPANARLWPTHRLLCLGADSDDTNRRCDRSRDRTGGSDVRPLSEREQRLLDQIERALQAENPKLASALRGRYRHESSRLRFVEGVTVFAIGLVLLVVGVGITSLSATSGLL